MVKYYIELNHEGIYTYTKYSSNKDLIREVCAVEFSQEKIPISSEMEMENWLGFIPQTNETMKLCFTFPNESNRINFTYVEQLWKEEV